MGIRNNLGFSLGELMVVIGIFALVAAIAVPNYLSWRRGAKVRGAVDNLRGDLNMAKFMAVRENAFVVVNFDPNNSGAASNRYLIFVDNGVGVGGVAADWNQNGEESVLRNRQLPAGVSIDLAGTDFNNERTRFSQRGLPSNLGKVVVVGKSGDQREIDVNRLGRITVQ